MLVLSTHYVLLYCPVDNVPYTFVYTREAGIVHDTFSAVRVLPGRRTYCVKTPTKTFQAPQWVFSTGIWEIVIGGWEGGQLNIVDIIICMQGSPET